MAGDEVQNLGCRSTFWSEQSCGLNGINCLPFEPGTIINQFDLIDLSNNFNFNFNLFS
jgi:hypothetical protein